MTGQSDPAARAAVPAAKAVGLVVEDQVSTRNWLLEVLREAFPETEFVAAGSLKAARAWLRQEAAAAPAFGLAVLDIGLPDGSGIELVRELAESHPMVIPIVASIYDDDAHLFDAIAAGARGYLLKDEDRGVLIGYLKRIERGEPPLSPAVANRMMAYFRGKPPGAGGQVSLSQREREVLALLARGMTVREAARQLGLAEHTVAGYIKIVYQKLNISTRAQAALEAAKRKLI